MDLFLIASPAKIFHNFLFPKYKSEFKLVFLKLLQLFVGNPLKSEQS